MFVRSKIGPGDTKAERTPMPWKRLKLRQLIPLRSRKRWLAAFSNVACPNNDCYHATTAYSDDDGKTWKGFREIFLNEIRNACDFRELGNSPADEHDKSVHQTQAIELKDGRVLIAFSNHLYVRSLTGGWRGWAGHCAWNRMVGATLVRDPYTDNSLPGEPRSNREVLQLCRIRDSRLVSDRQGVVWNFPAARKGTVTLTCRIVGIGFRLTLADHWMNPCDEVGPAVSPFSHTVDLPALRASGWHKLAVSWDCDTKSAVMSVDGNRISAFSLSAAPRFGLSYLHLQTLAEGDDEFGAYFSEFTKR